MAGVSPLDCLRAGAVLVALSAVLVSAPGCSVETGAAAKNKTASPATPVVMKPVAVLPERTRLEAVGTSRARKSVTLYPAVPGEVVAVNFEPGQRVAAGDVLVRLDARDEALAVKLAKVRLEEAERAYNRYLRSEKRGAVTRATIDDARSAVEAARIELDRAMVALDDRTLEAPFDGVVGITDIDRGARVNPDTPIASLDDRSVLIVRFEVPEALSGRIKQGDTVSVAPWSGRGEAIQGRVVDIDSRIDPLSRTFVARAHVNNKDDKLRPGMSFRVTLELEGKDHPVVPEVSVQWGGEGSYVWSVAEGEVRRVPVTIVQRLGGRVLVDAPLETGTLVVVEGVQRMREGRKVSQFDPKILAGDNAAEPGGTREKRL